MVVSPFIALDNHHILLHIQDVAMVTVLGGKMTISDSPEHELIRLNTFFWICSKAFLFCFRSTQLLITKRKVLSCTMKPRPWASAYITGKN